jgi:gluconolactonase
MIKPVLRVLLFLSATLLLINCGQAPDSGTQGSMVDQPPNDRQAPAAPDLPPPPGLLAEGASWETLFEGYVYSDGPAADAIGNVYFAEVTFNHIYMVDPAGEITLEDEDTAMTMGLVVGPDGLLYGCRNHDAQIVRYTRKAGIEVLLQGAMTPLPDRPNAPGEFCNDMAINAAGGIWFTDRLNERVMYLDPDGSVRPVSSGFRPNGIVLSADRKMLIVTDSVLPRLHAFTIGERGALSELADFYDPILTVEQLRGEQIAPGRPGTNGMTVDADGRLYVASFYGIQVFDRDGRYIGVIGSPREFLSNLTFGGRGYEWLYATGRQGIFRLEMAVNGVGW